LSWLYPPGPPPAPPRSHDESGKKGKFLGQGWIVWDVLEGEFKWETGKVVVFVKGVVLNWDLMIPSFWGEAIKRIEGLVVVLTLR
jgi:hypothetical protein